MQRKPLRTKGIHYVNGKKVNGNGFLLAVNAAEKHGRTM